MIEISGHTFDEKLIDSSSIVVDVGANHGDFSKGIVTRFGCYVEAYEPEVQAFFYVSSTILFDKFLIVNRAVSGETKISKFYIAAPFSGGNSLVAEHTSHQIAENPTQQDVFCVSLSSIIHRLGKIDLLKLDCEGAELSIIMDTPLDLLKKVRQISVEFHAFCIPTQGKKEIEDCMKYLAAAGFKGPMTFEETNLVDCHYIRYG